MPRGRNMRNVGRVAGLLALAVSAATAGVFDSWSHREKITFTGYGKAALTNYPALVIIGTNTPSHEYVAYQPNGADVRFANSNETVELAYEIEKWNTNGLSYLWVRVPRLAGTNTFIWHYWGKVTNAPAYSTNGLAWDTNYVGVWHMHKTNATDSTTNRFHGSPSGIVTRVETGMIARGDGFVRPNSCVSVPDSSLFTLAMPYTVSAWIRPDPVAGWMGFVGTYNNVGFFFTLNTVKELTFWGGAYWYSGYIIPDSQWSHVVFTKKGSDGYFYVNGRRVGSISSALSMGNGGNLHLGGGGVNYAANSFDGLVDEVRISRTDRSSNWVWACAINQASNSAFTTYGPVVYPVLTVLSLPVSNLYMGSAVLSGLVGGTGGGPNPRLYFCWDTVDRGAGGTAAWARVGYVGTNWTAGQSFSLAITNLAHSAVYFFRAYATNSTGSDFSEPRSFRVRSTWFVRSAGSDAAQGTNWATALASISNAVTRSGAGDIVLVTNGVYTLTNPVVIPKALTLRSVNGRAATIVKRTLAKEIRLVVVSNAGAVVDGFTFTNGMGRANTTNLAAYPGATGNSYGGAIRMYGGTVRNCRIVKNTCKAGITNSQHNIGGYGGGIYMVTGLVENCEILNNTATGTGSDWAYGGGIEMIDGQVVGCTITGNLAQASGNGEGRGGGVRISGSGRLLSSLLNGNKVSAANNVAPSYGAGVYLGGNGIVSNCTMVRNRCIFWENLGAGVYLTTGLVTHCTIVSNRSETAHSYADTQYAAGSGVWISGGTVRNCVVAQNVCTHTGQIREGATRGAGILMTGGRVENCTVSRNVVDRYGRGAGLYMTGGQVWNSVFYYNFDDAATSYTEDHENVYQSGGTVNYSCFTNTYAAVTGTGNTCGDPGFAYRWTNDYRLLPGSPCIDRGSNLVAVTRDRDNNARPQDGDGNGQARNDMGAFEAVPLNQGALRANFRVQPGEAALGSLNATLAAQVAGSQTSGLYYAWDFGNDGSVEYKGADKGSITTNLLNPGYYTVKLTVSNSVPTGVSVLKRAILRVFPSVVYARPTGAPVFPYNTWTKAATNLQDAFDATCPGATVLLTSGTYRVATPLSLRRGITVSSFKGPQVTFLDRKSGANTRIILVLHPSAVLERVTIRNGSFANSGMAYGGGLWLSSGLVRNCIISSNLVRGLPNQPGYGGGIYQSGGTVRNCLILKNESRTDNNYAHGGGMYITAGLVENCTVVTNYCQYPGVAGTNSARALGGGIRLAGGSLTNTIVANNSNRGLPVQARQISVVGVTNAGYCCSTDLKHDPAGKHNITNAPQFTAIATNDYRLESDSPCKDVGIVRPWMIGTFDLAGAGRNQKASVDMGAYEIPSAPGTLFLFL